MMVLPLLDSFMSWNIIAVSGRDDGGDSACSIVACDDVCSIVESDSACSIVGSDDGVCPIVVSDDDDV